MGDWVDEVDKPQWPGKAIGCFLTGFLLSFAAVWTLQKWVRGKLSGREV